MSKRLVIAEKPSVARDLAEALGPFETHAGGDWFETDDYVISFAVGHLLELAAPEDYDPEWKKWTRKVLPIVPGEFRHTPRDKNAKTRLRLLAKLAKREDVVAVVNACDAGREGEHIFRTIEAQLGCELPTQRLWLNSLTKAAIQDGFAHLRDGQEFDALGAAAASRSEADWLIGINATRSLTARLRSLRYDGAWTAGRVQTPTLTMCVLRELEIQDHRAEPYWEINGRFGASDHEYEGHFRRRRESPDDEPQRIKDRAQMERIKALLDAATGATPPVRCTATETRKRRDDHPPLPYDLTSLQRASGLTARRTQDVAQALYERHKVLSYPRTDSRYLPSALKPEFAGTLRLLKSMPELGATVLRIEDRGPKNFGKVFNDAKVSDHHALIPVDVPRPGQLGPVEERIYLLVVRQFLAAFMEPARWENVSRETVVHTDEDLTFRSTGRLLVDPGWRFALGKRAGDGDPLAKLEPSAGASVTFLGHDVEEKETKPKGRLSDAGLLTKMENCGKEVEDEALAEILRERGLGTPATRADTIERLISRGYLAREGKALRATAKAIRLIETLRRVGELTLTSPELTGEMEHQLRQVEHGELARDAYMKTVVTDTTSLVGTLLSFDFDSLYAPEADIAPCPEHPDQPIRETAWGYSCAAEEGSGFFIWKDVSGHVVTRQEMTELLLGEEHRIGPVTLFRGSRGKSQSYQASLQLKRHTDAEYEALPRKKNGKEPSRWTLQIMRENGADQPVGDDAGPAEEAVGPFCTTEKGVEIVETNLRYVDREHLEGAQKPKAVLPKLVCQREMKPEEAQAFFTAGDTGFLDDFISKRGRPFRAKLYLKGNGRHGFEFEPRAPRKKAAKKTVKKATKKATKKTAAKKTAKKTTKKASKKTVKKAAKKTAAQPSTPQA